MVANTEGGRKGLGERGLEKTQIGARKCRSFCIVIAFCLNLEKSSHLGVTGLSTKVSLYCEGRGIKTEMLRE